MKKYKMQNKSKSSWRYYTNDNFESLSLWNDEGRHMKTDVFQESLWSLSSKHFGGFQGRSHAAAPLIGRIRGCLPRGPWGRPKLRSAILVNWKNVVLRTDRSPQDVARLWAVGPANLEKQQPSQ